MKKMSIYNGKPQNCKKCGTLIGFTKNRKGKYYPVDLFVNSEGNYEFISGIGNHGNYTPWHKCDTSIPDFGFYEFRFEFYRVDKSKVNDLVIFVRQLNELNEKDQIQICHALKCEWMIYN